MTRRPSTRLTPLLGVYIGVLALAAVAVALTGGDRGHDGGRAEGEEQWREHRLDQVERVDLAAVAEPHGEVLGRHQQQA